jgi:hypothetical protein
MKKPLLVAASLIAISTGAYAQVGASNSSVSAGVSAPAIPPVGEGLDINGNAAVSTPGIDKRQERQDARIRQGVESGELNEREANRLERQQERIDRIETRAEADGTVTARERARIHHKQHQANRNIRHQKHDRQ